MKKIINFYQLIDIKYRVAALLLVIVLFFNSILEMLLIGVLYPLISLLIDPETNFDGNFIYQILLKLRLYNDNSDLIINLNILVSIVFGLKIIINLITLFFQNKYSFSLLQNLSYKLFSSYISKNFIDTSKENSSYLVRNLTYNLNTFINGMNAFINIISELFIIISITILLLFINFKISITLLVFFVIASSIFLFLTKFKIQQLSKQRFVLEGKKIKNINENLAGLVDIKLSGNIFFYKKIYFEIENLLKSNYTNLQVLLGLPKIWIELLTIGTFIFLIQIFYHAANTSFAIYIPLIGLYALSAFKLMPSFNRIIINLNTVKFTQEVFSNMFIELRKLKLKSYFSKDEKITECYNLKIKNLNFFYDKKKIIFENLNLIFKKNKTYGIYGPSGTGKSTLVNLILGLIKPNEGKIQYNDKLDISKNLLSWQETISYIPQKPYFFDDTILKNIAVGLDDNKIDIKKIYFCLRIVNLEKKINKLKNKHNTIIGEVGKKFSGGELQRIAIARALYKTGNIIILDEATSALDVKNESQIVSRIKKEFRDKIIIIISHKKKLIDDCDFKIKL